MSTPRSEAEVRAVLAGLLSCNVELNPSQREQFFFHMTIIRTLQWVLGESNAIDGVMECALMAFKVLMAENARKN
jgi:hypothetical protein